MGNESFIKQHSLAIYFVLVFLIAWVGSFVAVGSKFLQGRAIEFSDVGLMSLPMLLAPFISGLVMSYLSDREGIRELFGRMKIWKVGGRWFFPLLVFPALLVCVSLVLTDFWSAEFALTFNSFGLFGGILAGLLEETGWTGFAFPRMIRKTSIIKASVYLGVIHGVWHLMADFLGNYYALGGFWLPYFIGFVLHVVALRVLIGWVYANTGSLLLAVLMHFSSTGFYGTLISTTLSPESRMIFYITYGIVLCVTASIVALKYGKNLKT